MAELVVKLKGRELKRIAIAKTVITIGRDPDNDLVIENPGISRRHATIRLESEAFVVQDEGSANGILVNGALCKREKLYHGDQILLGKFLVIFEDHTGTSSQDDMEVVTTGEVNAFLQGRQDPKPTVIVDARELAKAASASPAEPPRPAAAFETYRGLKRPDEIARLKAAGVRSDRSRTLEVMVVVLAVMVLVLSGVAIWLGTRG